MKVSILRKNGHQVIDLNRRKAIQERCLNCAAWSYKEATDCIFENCLLYPFRSGRGKQDAGERARAIRCYCLWCVNDQPGDVSKCTSQDCSLYPYRKSRTDRSAEIKALPGIGHIGLLSEDENKSEYLNIE